MVKSRFSYLKLTALVAVLAIALIPSLCTSMAREQPSDLVTATAGSSNASQDAALCHCFGLGVGCSGYAPNRRANRI